MGVGAIWVASWLMLAGARLVPGMASAVFVATYGVFALGETIYSPVLSPLTATLAPPGMVGRTLGVITALQTAFSAVGPLFAGVLLGAGQAGMFLLLHLMISAAAVLAAWKVRRALVARTEGPRPLRPEPTLPAELAGPTGMADAAAA